jgi:hypothetical protein
MTAYEQQVPDREAKNIKDVLTAYRYHQIQEVQTNLINQVRRIRDMMNNMESYLAGQTISNRNGNFDQYVPIGLGNFWIQFMQSKVVEAKSKAETYMDTYIQRLKDGYCSAYQRQNANAEDQILITKIDSLEAAVNAKPNWVVPNF